MKAAQITQYTKNIRIKVNNVPIPKMGDHDVLIRVKAAAVNPVDILNLTGAVRLIQDYKMPLTLGNECAVSLNRWASTSPDSSRETGSIPACRSAVLALLPNMRLFLPLPRHGCRRGLTLRRRQRFP